MKGMLKQVFGWHAGPPAWGPAVIAGLGCALPLVLGLFSGHPGFLWASVGAFLAAQSNPLHRFGMLRLLLLTLFGACSAGLGFWAASDAVLSLVLFAAYGFLLAWLQRFGTEAGKLGLGLTVCLCLGQGQFGISGLHNPDAVAALFILGGLWVALLAFGSLLGAALGAGDELNATVANMRFVKPLDTAIIEQMAGNHSLLVSIEENAVIGGAGAEIARVLEEQELQVPLLRLGLPDRFIDHGEQGQLLAELGLDRDGIIRAVQARLSNRKRDQ